jgi:phosphate transport system substrate-binding protein
MKQFLFSALLTVGAVIPGAVAAPPTVDASLAPYKPVAGLSGKLDSVGSDTLDKLMHAWAKGFTSMHSGIVLNVEGKGSVTAPPALTSGKAQLAPMSREMWRTESDAFKQKFGYEPTAIPVAIDALAVFVHKDNPIRGLTLRQLDGIFSTERKRGGANITNWDQLGVAHQWQGKKIVVYGRNTISGTHGFFSEHALLKGTLKGTVKQQPGSEAVATHVANDIFGIGYSGIGYVTPEVRALALGETEEHLWKPSQNNCITGHYPLRRFLFVYVNKKPGQPLDGATHEFLKFVLSKEGQEIVAKTGFFPLGKAGVALSSTILEK